MASQADSEDEEDAPLTEVTGAWLVSVSNGVMTMAVAIKPVPYRLCFVRPMLLRPFFSAAAVKSLELAAMEWTW